MKDSRTIIVGLGNPILGDDGIGWRIAEELQAKLNYKDVDVICSSRGGLHLMEAMIGYNKAIIIDSFVAQESKNGSVSSFSLENLPEQESRHTVSTHDTSLKQALKMGKRLGLSLPAVIHVVAITSPLTFDFSEEMSEDVATAIPQAFDEVVELLTPERQENKMELTK